MNLLVEIIGITGILVFSVGILMVIILQEIFTLLAQDYKLKSEAILQESSKPKADHVNRGAKIPIRQTTEIYTDSSAC
ncbi:MAG: hypothetical protein U7127_17970 [Phormidium sp.]